MEDFQVLGLIFWLGFILHCNMFDSKEKRLQIINGFLFYLSLLQKFNKNIFTQHLWVSFAYHYPTSSQIPPNKLDAIFMAQL